jgi:hypothetical protein
MQAPELLIMTTTDSLFQNLPTELLEIIFNNLRRLPGSLRSLAQTSRRFYNIIIPILYSSICLRNSNSGKKFAETVQNSSALSSLVRELQVHYHHERIDEVHESLLDALFELKNLEALSLRSLPLDCVLEEQNNRLLGMFVPRSEIVEMRLGSAIAGDRLRSCKTSCGV